jgi:hypothetical protein
MTALIIEFGRCGFGPSRSGLRLWWIHIYACRHSILDEFATLRRRVDARQPRDRSGRFVRAS